MTVENDKDRIHNQSFKESLRKLSDINNPTPLQPEELNVKDIRDSLILSGIRLDLLEDDLDLLASIGEPKCRNFYTGIGTAFVVAVGGMYNATEYLEWAYQNSLDQSKTSRGDKYSKARGLMHFAADTIRVALNENAEEYCQKVNLRVGKKYKHNPAIAAAFGLPTKDDLEGQKNLKKFSSIPKGSAVKAYDKLLLLNKT